MISNEAVEAAVREVDRFVYKPPADELPSIEGHKNALMRAVLEAAEAKAKQAENLIAKARTLSDTLKAYGYPVSPAHWANASGQMSVQARALHMAAENLIEGLAALRWTQGEGE